VFCQGITIDAAGLKKEAPQMSRGSTRNRLGGSRSKMAADWTGVGLLMGLSYYSESLLIVQIHISEPPGAGSEYVIHAYIVNNMSLTKQQTC